MALSEVALIRNICGHGTLRVAVNESDWISSCDFMMSAFRWTLGAIPDVGQEDYSSTYLYRDMHQGVT